MGLDPLFAKRAALWQSLMQSIANAQAIVSAINAVDELIKEQAMRVPDPPPTEPPA